MKTAEDILDKHYQPKMHWKLINREHVLKAMRQYAEQERERAFNEARKSAFAIDLFGQESQEEVYIFDSFEDYAKHNTLI